MPGRANNYTYFALKCTKPSANQAIYTGTQRRRAENCHACVVHRIFKWSCLRFTVAVYMVCFATQGSRLSHINMQHLCVHINVVVSVAANTAATPT